jgi:hypothetical protein
LFGKSFQSFIKKDVGLRRFVSIFNHCFLEFFKVFFLNSGFSIFEIRVINKSSYSSTLVKTLEVFVLLQQESKHPTFTSSENSLAE